MIFNLTISLFVIGIAFNIAIGLLIIGITVTIHGFGSSYWIRHLDANYYNLSHASLNKKTKRLLITTALFLLILNFFEAIIWAFVYYLLPGITEFETLEKAVYFSLVTFTTLGYGEITISSSNRILAGFEAMNGVLLLGWSTTMMLSVMQFMMKNSFKNNKK